MRYSLEYSGSKGVNLYSISYPNQYGFGNLALGDPCTGNGDCVSQPNPNYGEDVGYRGNQGFSTYQGINNRLAIQDLFHLGIALTATYTWSHAIDNMSSTFFEAGGQGVASQYGNQNITINNGDFDAGFLDPYQPALDKGNAEFDIRHRVTLQGNWPIPPWKKPGWIGALTRGWSLNPLFTGRSGQPFSVFDTSSQTLDLNAPRATLIGNYPTRRNTFVPSAEAPDLIQLITFLPSEIAREPNPLTPGAQWPAKMTARDAFRAPGFVNLDVGIHKDTRLTERLTLQLRGEFFNVLNHANLYVIGTSADVGTGNTVNACFGCTGSNYDQREIQLAARVKFLNTHFALVKETPSTPARHLTLYMRWLAPGSMSLFYFLAALIFIPYPGLQNDELFFSGSLFSPEFTYYRLAIGSAKIPLMVMSYSGALKTWLYAPLFGWMAPSVWSVRVPVALIGAATVWLTWIWVRRIAGIRAAVIATALLASDTLYLLTDVFDWGPVALQHLLLMGGLIAVHSWISAGSRLALAAGFFFWDSACGIRH